MLPANWGYLISLVPMNEGLKVYLYNLHSCCEPVKDVFRVCSAGVSVLVIQLSKIKYGFQLIDRSC